MRYVVETRLTGNFQSLSDAKAWAKEQRENDMQVTAPQKLVTGEWLCIATETSTIESYKL
ncbi:hypothetical protein MA20_31995 [Bradyrhizobium japonicum]|uniref:Uncharacterized protein n=1 Tax=Bradyrhizobium japonicum TaxID=375 RepID=A0A0A3XRA0_BRAJP|nr:hypothetical protein [Bradyrhizobium japonicum]KGT75814.1 hypothetical protein MA20_31995 [Bradyrhizobium japonicum]